MKKPLSDFPLKWQESHNIYSNDIEGEIWLMFENLSGTQYLDSVIRKRINQSQIQNLTQSIIKKIQNQPTKRARQIQALAINDVTDILDETRNVILQARDIYFAARSLPLLSKPILLFYSFEKLAESLYFMTYKKTEYGHGLWYDKSNHTITICKNGFFANFHDSYSDDAFYLNEPSIRFEDVIECGPIYQKELDSSAWHDITYPIRTTDNNQISLTELDRELIFLYGLSILARYNVKGWANILSGVDNPISTNIKVINHLRIFTRAVELLFPNLILNEIYLKKVSIYSPMKPMSTEWENYDDKALQ